MGRAGGERVLAHRAAGIRKDLQVLHRRKELGTALNKFLSCRVFCYVQHRRRVT